MFSYGVPPWAHVSHKETAVLLLGTSSEEMENDDIDETSDISNFPYEDNYLEPHEPEEISEEYQDTNNGKGKSVRLRSTKFSREKVL